MMPKIEDRLTICASRCRERCGRKARVPCTTPQKLMLNSQSICAWSTSSNSPSSATPALLMTMLSAGMGRDRGSARNPGSAPGSPTSTRCVVTLRPGFCRSRRRPAAARPRRDRPARDRSRARPAPAPARGRCRWRRRSRRRRFRISQSFGGLHAGLEEMSKKRRAGSPTFANWNRTIKRFRRLTSTTSTTTLNRRELSREASWDNQNPFARPHSLSKTIRCSGK